MSKVWIIVALVVGGVVAGGLATWMQRTSGGYLLEVERSDQTACVVLDPGHPAGSDDLESALRDASTSGRGVVRGEQRVTSIVGTLHVASEEQFGTDLWSAPPLGCVEWNEERFRLVIVTN